MEKGTSDMTLYDLWEGLKAMNCVELRVNGKTLISEAALDIYFGQPEYDSMCSKLLAMEDKELEQWKDYSFRVTDASIQVVDGHHTIASVIGYYEDGPAGVDVWKAQ